MVAQLSERGNDLAGLLQLSRCDLVNLPEQVVRAADRRCDSEGRAFFPLG